MSKKKYMCMQRSQSGKCDKPSPANMEEMYAKFNAWREKFQDALVDMGGGLRPGKLVTVEGVQDGPFAESKELIGGYMIVQADSLEEAIEVARECPGLVSPGSGVEVREINTP